MTSQYFLLGFLLKDIHQVGFQMLSYSVESLVALASMVSKEITLSPFTYLWASLIEGSL